MTQKESCHCISWDWNFQKFKLFFPGCCRFLSCGLCVSFCTLSLSPSFVPPSKVGGNERFRGSNICPSTSESHFLRNPSTQARYQLFIIQLVLDSIIELTWLRLCCPLRQSLELKNETWSYRCLFWQYDDMNSWNLWSYGVMKLYLYWSTQLTWFYTFLEICELRFKVEKRVV